MAIFEEGSNKNRWDIFLYVMLVPQFLRIWLEEYHYLDIRYRISTRRILFYIGCITLGVYTITL